MNFDWKQYILNYRDLRDKGIIDKFSALRHWNKYGKREKRTDQKISGQYDLKITRLPESELVINVSTSKTVLPPVVDLRSKFPPCYDQGQLGSCTANAIVGAYQFLNPSFMGSRLFQYYNERVIENDVSQDNGATITDSIKAVEKNGLCPETEWVYNISKFATKPPAQCYTDGLKHVVKKAYNVAQTISSMKGYLNSGYPFIVGIVVYNSFESNAVSLTGMVPLPPANRYDFVLGGHCVVVCGYNDNLNGGVWIVRNSWGTGWGVNGYFYLPYSYLTNPNLCSDNWCIEL